ncbi:hypothetical protein LguiA_002874 [Lonicera macranthoides]
MATPRVQFTLTFLLMFSIVLQPRVLLEVQANDLDQDSSYLQFVYNATESPSEELYDYIVVGGGTAGCPLATTLSENYSVLLIERGGVAFNDPNVLLEENLIANLLQADDIDSPAEAFTSEDGILNARGRVLGGSSMINFGFYSRADEDFYVESGIEWNMSIVKSAYEWVEEAIVTKTDRINSWQTSVKRALLQSGIRPDNGLTFDHLQGTKIGGSTFDRTGRRHGAVELLNKAKKKNLRVVVHATVERVVFASNTSLGLSAIGVIYRDTNGNSHIAGIREKGEIILSAGALGSPQLLLMSGVGPRSYLSSLNIPIVYDQPLIGQFMADNPRNQITFTPPFPLDDIGIRVAGITKSFYIEAVSGIASFFSPVSPILFPDPYPPLNLTVLTIFEKLSRPLSTGSLRLASPTNASLTPIVRFNYFNDTTDLSQCANAMRAIGKMLRTSVMEQYKSMDQHGQRYFKFVGHALPQNQFDDEAMREFCHKTLTTVYHYHGGCLAQRVVDSHLKVIGINALRVVDGSTFVVSPGTNPQATVMMFGRYIGVKILEERKANYRDA